MNNFGRQNVTPGVTNQFIVGRVWEYIQVINESPYILTATFEGMGSMDIASWHKEDVQVNRVLFNGQLFLLPANITTGQASPPSTTVSVNAFSPGELSVPKSVALSRAITNSQGNIVAGNIDGTTFNGSATVTRTLNNKAGSTLFIDGFDIYLDANGTGAVAVEVLVKNTVAGFNIPFEYFAPTGSTIPNTVDHVSFINRGQGLPQSGTSNIVVTVTMNASLGTSNPSSIVIHYHYETNY